MSRVIKGFPFKIGIECVANNVVFQRKNSGVGTNKRNDVAYRDERGACTVYD